MSDDGPGAPEHDSARGARSSANGRRKSGGIPESSVYRAWCERSDGFVNRERFVVFQTIGRAPVESPPHPARLSPVRQMAQLGALTSGGTTGTSTSSGGETLDDSSFSGWRPRTFPAECSKVLADQCAVEAFNPQRIYLACEFFSVCSLCFIRELVAIGESALWQGITFDSKAVIYSEGDSGTSMYVVVRGAAEAVSKGREPRQLRTYDYFGEAQALGVLPERRETVTARTSLHVLEVSCSTLTKLLRRERSQDLAADSFPAMTKPPATPRSTRAKSSDLNTEHAMPRSPRSPRAPRTPRCGTASARFYAFAEERRHFEHVSAHLYQQLVRRHHPQVRLRPTTTATGIAHPPAGGGTGAEAVEEEAGGTAAALPGQAPTAEEVPEPAGASRRGAAGSQRRAQAQAHRKGAAAPAAAAHVCGVDNPRLWRKHLEEVRVMLTEGDMSDDGLGRERFAQRLTESIRGDMRRGYMMPADLGKVRKNLVSGTSSATRTPVMWHAPGSSSNTSGQASGLDTSKGHRKIGPEGEGPTEEEEEEAPGETHLLDLRLLPPLAFMNTRQKHALLQQMQRQTRTAAKNQAKQAMRTRVTSIVHLAGLSKMFSSRKSLNPALAELAAPASAPSPPGTPPRTSRGSDPSPPTSGAPTSPLAT